MGFLYGFVFIKKAKLIVVVLFTDVVLRAAAAGCSPTPVFGPPSALGVLFNVSGGNNEALKATAWTRWGREGD